MAYATAAFVAVRAGGMLVDYLYSSNAYDDAEDSITGYGPVGAGNCTAPPIPPPFHRRCRLVDLLSLFQVVKRRWDEGFDGRPFTRANSEDFARTEKVSEVYPVSVLTFLAEY